MAAMDTVATEVAARLRDRAEGYYPGLSREVRPRLVRRTNGFVSTTLQFVLEAGDSTQQVLVKVARRTSLEPAPADRPRLAPICEPQVRPALEHATMSRVHDHFDALDDPRFGSVRVLDLWSEPRAVVMELIAGKTMRRLLLRRGSSGGDMEPVVANTGAWLRSYHALADIDHAVERHTRRDEFVGTICEMTDYLGDTLGRQRYFTTVAEMTGTASAALPNRLPVGVGHGDFAPRNVLVGGGGKVTVIDTLARWRTPIYEDLGCFLTSIRTLGPQVYSQGRLIGAAHLERLSEAFLGAYFAERTIPREAVRLYEIQALLGRWVSVAHRQRSGDQAARWINRAAGWITDRYFRRCLESSLRALGPDPAGSALSRDSLRRMPRRETPEALR